jgi:hypothetical protein
MAREVVGTRDTVEMFGTAFAECGKSRTSVVNGLPVTVIDRVQVRKGAPRGTFYVVDFGEVRATVAPSN